MNKTLSFFIWAGFWATFLFLANCDKTSDDNSNEDASILPDSTYGEDQGSDAAESDLTDIQEADGNSDLDIGLDAKCQVSQPFPYLNSPYPGIHGTATNNERIFCDGPETMPIREWQSLNGMMIFNPVTVSSDRIYAVTAHTSGCKLWHIDLESGSSNCLPLEDPNNLTFGVLGSSPELDIDENIYITDGWDTSPDRVVSYTRSGELRWRRTFENIRTVPKTNYSPPLGVHFTPEGYVATVTPDGLVVLLAMDDREDGILTVFNIPEETGLAPVRGKEVSLPPVDKIPAYLLCRIKNVLGEDIPIEDLLVALTGGTGGSGAFTDNTIAGYGSLLFVAGGSKNNGSGFADKGALIALKINEGPILSLHWYMETESGTGSSPTVDPTGRFVVVTDYNSQERARLVVADISICEGVTGQNPPLCSPAWTYTLEGGPLNAHVSIDEDGIVYAWNQGRDELGKDIKPELIAVSGPDENHAEAYIKWSATFDPITPGRWTSSEWSSTVLVLNNIVVGTVSHISAIDIPDEYGNIPLPISTRTEHELVGVRRSDGNVLWRLADMPDDSINSPLLGPDGNIYVPILGMLDFAKIPTSQPTDCSSFVEKDFQGGVLKFRY